MEAEYGIILKTFFNLISQIFEKKKKRNKSKFSWLALLFKHFLMKIQPNMSEQEKKGQSIYVLLNVEIEPPKNSKIISFFMASFKPGP